jgi:hypothetical protein
MDCVIDMRPRWLVIAVSPNRDTLPKGVHGMFNQLYDMLDFCRHARAIGYQGIKTIPINR